MNGAAQWLFGLDGPLAGRTDLIVLHGAADFLIAASCVSIALALYRFLHRRRDIAFTWFFRAFAGFVLFLGLVHLVQMVTIWRPWFGLEGVLKLAAAGFAAAVAIAVWPLLPRIMRLPSPQQYAGANRRLQKAMDALAQSHAELESRVSARTRELEEATDQLEARRREAEHAAEERAVLLREMHHRTGNNLQIISSFVGLTLRGVKDPAAASAIREIRARLAAITDVNRLLLRSDTLAQGRADDYLQQLAEDLGETMLGPETPIEIRTALEPVEFSADRLTYLGLVAVELITNAVKYAFPEGGGVVEMRLARTPDGVVFEVADAGQGFDPETVPKGAGAGAAIVRQFAQRLDATVDQDAAPGRGVRVRLLMPATIVEDGGPAAPQI